MPYQAVLFDLDGTLLDTLEDLAVSMNAALATLGYPPHPVEAYRWFVGDGMRNLAKRVIPPEQHEEALLRRVVDQMWVEYSARRGATTRPYPGIPEMLDALAATDLKLAILSNKPDALAKQVVAEKLGAWTFAPVYGARDGVPIKPDPRAALAIADELGVAPAEVLYVGDTNTDMQTAVAAGMPAVGAVWGFRTAEELTAAGAEYLIETPLELLRLLES